MFTLWRLPPPPRLESRVKVCFPMLIIYKFCIPIWTQLIFSSLKQLDQAKKSDDRLILIPRPREVRQSYLTSILSTLTSIFYCIPIMVKLRPDIVLCNGPGTCIPIAGIAWLMKLSLVKVFMSVYWRILSHFWQEGIPKIKKNSIKYSEIFLKSSILHWPELGKRRSFVQM